VATYSKQLVGSASTVLCTNLFIEQKCKFASYFLCDIVKNEASAEIVLSNILDMSEVISK